ncbi:unnamed protein product [Rotaria socialis]
MISTPENNELSVVVADYLDESIGDAISSNISRYNVQAIPITTHPDFSEDFCVNQSLDLAKLTYSLIKFANHSRVSFNHVSSSISTLVPLMSDFFATYLTDDECPINESTLDNEDATESSFRLESETIHYQNV